MAKEMVKVFSKMPSAVEFRLSNGDRIIINGVDRRIQINMQGDSMDGTTLIPKETWEQIQKEYKDQPLIHGSYINAVSVQDNTKQAIDRDEELVDGVDPKKLEKELQETTKKTAKNSVKPKDTE